MGLMKSDVSFEVYNESISFSIVHNMPEIKGLSFNDALNNWLARTTEYTAESLCKYVKSKNVNIFIQPYKSENQ